MGESSERGPGLTRALDSGLSAGDRDPYALLANLLGGAEVGDETEVLSLHGRVLDGVQLGRIVGTGGMGVTYAGVDADGERVAVKILGRLGEIEQARFERECEVVQALDHRNLVRYRRHGVTPGGTPYLVMDLVEGDDLDALLGAIERGESVSSIGEALVAGLDPSLPVHGQVLYRQRILRLLAAVAEGLEHAHRAGLVHRDVKPANVVVCVDLSPVLVDFGLAHDLFRDASWTRSGAAVGTVGWMAPEQLDGNLGAVGPRTDVFALGLLLHRALTGRELRRDLKDLLRFREGRLVLEKNDVAGLDAGAVAVLYGCLEPAPEHRYPSALAFAHDLRALADGTGVRRRSPGWLRRSLRRRRIRLGLATVALVGSGSVIAAFWPRTPSVTITCLEDDQNGQLQWPDGGLFLSGPRLPVTDLRVPRGVYDLVYHSKRIGRVPFQLVVDRPHVRLDILNVPRGELERLAPAEKQYEGAGFALLDVLTHQEGAHLRINGEAVPWSVSRSRQLPAEDGAAGARFRRTVAPGTYSIELVTPEGLREQQDVAVAPYRLVPIVLLGHRLWDVVGSFRVTWASVLAPVPDGLRLEYGANAGTFLDALGLASALEYDQEQVQLGYIHNRRNTGVTGLVADEEATALLTVTFPTPMRSLVAIIPVHRTREDDRVALDWRLDQGSWATLEVRAAQADRDAFDIVGLGTFERSGEQVIDCSDLPAPGASQLQIRFRISPRQRSIDMASASVLTAYVNEIDTGRAWAAFAIVADPDPSPRRRR